MCNPNENYSITEHTAVSKIFHPLLALVASATDSELAKYVEYLKEENKILRARLPKQIHTTPDERKKLVRLGKQLGRAIEELITIVSPSTFYRWCREGVKSKKQSKGRPRKCVELRDLVIKIAKETGFGYTRIWRATKAGNHQDKPQHRTEHPQGGRHGARARPHFGCLGQVP